MKRKKIKLNLKVIIFIIIIFNIFARIPALFEPIWYGDECIYLTLGQGLNKGLNFYKDIHDNKPPLLYLIAGLAQARLFWLRLITLAWNTFNIFLIFKIAKKLLAKDWLVILTTLIFTLFSLLPEGRIANGEVFMIMPATLGLLFALKAKNEKNHFLWFLSGIGFATGFLFKIPIAFDFAGLLFGFFIFTKKTIKDVFTVLIDKRLYLTLAGFFLPIILSIIYYAKLGAFTPYVRSALLQNIGYLSSWSGSNTGLYLRGLLVLTATLALFIFRKRLGFNFYTLALMSFWGAFGVFLSERPYPHYLIEIAPWLALLTGVVLKEKKLLQILFAVFLGLSLFTGYKYYDFWWYDNLPYYKNFLRFTTRRISKEEYFRFFAGQKVIDDYAVSKYIQEHSSENDRIFVWGEGSCIYALSRRLPPGRYTATYHIFDFNGFEETLQAMRQTSPQLIIKLDSESRPFPGLNSLISQYYAQNSKVGEAVIYHKVVNY